MKQRIREDIEIQDAVQTAREQNMYLAAKTDTLEGDEDGIEVGI